jgi:antitoxin component of MazEF toxin-antitoxin module
MIKKLTKHGNSYALVIDRGIMDLLNISENTDLHITTDGKKLILTPVENKKQKAKFDAAVKLSFKKFGGAYKRLAAGPEK